MDLTIGVASFDKRLLDCIRLKRNNDEVASFLSACPRDASDFWGTLLHYSVLHGNEPIVRLLISLGWDVDLPEKSHSSRTPLMIAVELGHSAIVELLLDADADHRARSNDEGLSALQLALHPANFESVVVEAFLRRLQRRSPTIERLLEWLASLRCTPYEAAFLRDVEVVERVLELGFHVDSRGRAFRTALHAAVELVDLELVRWLLLNRADVNALDEYEATPLALLYERNAKHTPEHFRVLELMVDFGARLDARTSFGCPLASSLVRHGNAEVLRFLLLRCDLDLTTTDERDGRSLLHTLGENSSSGLLDALQHATDFDVDVRDRSGRTPLYSAVSHGNVQLVEFLLERGADPNDSRDDVARSPFYRAFTVLPSRRSSPARCVQLLLEHGADPQTLEYDEASPTIFELALSGKLYAKIYLVVAHVARMEVAGRTIDEETREEIEWVPRFRKYLESCRRVLKTEIFEGSSLGDLLSASDERMGIHVRNKEFVEKLRRIGRKAKLEATYPHYFEALRKRVDDAARESRLKYTAVAVMLEKLGGLRYGVCREVAEKIVGYLGGWDLECLCEV